MLLFFKFEVYITYKRRLQYTKTQLLAEFEGAFKKMNNMALELRVSKSTKKEKLTQVRIT